MSARQSPSHARRGYLACVFSGLGWLFHAVAAGGYPIATGSLEYHIVFIEYILDVS
jgi:hypothetical protein